MCVFFLPFEFCSSSRARFPSPAVRAGGSEHGRGTWPWAPSPLSCLSWFPPGLALCSWGSPSLPVAPTCALVQRRVHEGLRGSRLDPLEPLLRPNAAASPRASAGIPARTAGMPTASPGPVGFKPLAQYFLLEYGNVLLFRLHPHATLTSPQELNFISDPPCRGAGRRRANGEGAKKAPLDRRVWSSSRRISAVSSVYFVSASLSPISVEILAVSPDTSQTKFCWIFFFFLWKRRNYLYRFIFSLALHGEQNSPMC